MQIIENIKDTVSNFVHDNTKMIVAIVSIILLLVSSTIIVGIVQCSQTPKTVKPVVIAPDNSYTLVDDLYKPESKPLTEDYYLSREQKDNWSEEEFNQWFTLPDDTILDDLSDANNKIIEKITGAAP